MHQILLTNIVLPCSVIDMNLKDKLLLPFQEWIKNLKFIFQLRQHSEKEKWILNKDLDQDDIAQSVLLVALSLVVAFFVFYFQLTSSDPVFAQNRWKIIGQFLATPIRVISDGMLMVCFLFVGAYFNRCPKNFATAFRVTLRVMSIYPVLGFLMYWKLGVLVPLVIYGILVPRLAIRAYEIPRRNALIFFGAVYFSFFFIQFQTLIRD